MHESKWRSEEFLIYKRRVRKKFKFYNIKDIKYRYLRKNLIKDEDFSEAISNLMKKRGQT